MIVQRRLGQGLAAAAVAIQPAPMKRVVSLAPVADATLAWLKRRDR
jgi:hypothetical protein